MVGRLNHPSSLKSSQTLNLHQVAVPWSVSRKPWCFQQILVFPRFRNRLLGSLRCASTLRPHRQKEIGKPPLKESEKDEKYWEDKKIIALATAEQYDLQRLSKGLQEKYGLDVAAALRSKPSNWAPGVLHIQITTEKQSLKPNAPSFTQAFPEGSVKDFFFFEEGVIVGWGITPADQMSLLREIAPYSINPYNQHFSEHMYFEYTQDSVPDIDLDNDIVTVSGPNATAEKLAFSYGMARSVKLDSIEERMHDLISIIGTRVPHYLETGERHPKLKDHKNCSIQMARLLTFRYLLNIESNLLEQPEYLWEVPEHERLFDRMERALDVKHRVAMANRKLDIAQSNLEVLMKDLQEKKVFRIEVIIALLILIEIFFHLLDKSQTWQHFTWEAFLHSIFG